MSEFRLLFTNSPWLLLLLIPAFALVLIPYFRVHKRYRRNRNRVTSLVLLLIVMLLSVSVLAGMTFGFNEPVDTNEIILVVDMSHSMRNAYRETVDDPTVHSNISQNTSEFINHVLRQSDGTFKIGIVTFGRDQVLAATPSTNVAAVYNEFNNARLPDDRASNIAAALRFASNQFENADGARIVLITNGFETDGSADDVIVMLTLAGIRVDVVNFNSPIGSEFQINDIVLPSFQPTIGQEIEIGVTVQSSFTASENARITIYNNGERGASEIVSIQSGIHTHQLPHTFISNGAQILHAVIECLSDDIRDEVEYNNSFFSFFYLDTFDNILIIYRNREEGERFRDLIRRGEGLENGFVNIELASIIDVPPEKDLLDVRILRNYDKIVLANVGNRDMRLVGGTLRSYEFVDALHSFVHDYGGGLLVLGGDRHAIDHFGDLIYDANGNPVYESNVFNRSEVVGRRLQMMLPVTVIDWLPPIAVAIVVDVSGSMSAGDVHRPGWNRLQLARVAARSSLDALTPRDYVAVIAFCTFATLETSNHHPTEPNGMRSMLTHRSTIVSAINNLELRGGTHYIQALEMARDQLNLLEDVSHRHILFFTDGQPGHDVQFAIDIIENMYNDYGTTLSGIGIRGTFDTVTRMAQAGRGEAYLIYSEQDMTNLPFYLFRDLSRPEIREWRHIPFNARVHMAGLGWEINSEMDEIIAESGNVMPGQFGNFYGTVAKPGASVILSGLHNVPIYTRWNWGNGSVAALTANILCPYWGKDFLNDETGLSVQFLLNALKVIAPTENIRQDYIEIRVTEDNFTRHIEVFSFFDVEGSVEDTFRISIVRLAGPEGGRASGNPLSYEVIETFNNIPVFPIRVQSFNVGLHRISEGVYEMRGGVYEIRVEQFSPGSSYPRWRTQIQTIFSYSSVYDAFRCPSEAFSWMEGFAEELNGMVIVNTMDIFTGFNYTRAIVVDPRLIFIILAISLFLIDIAVRKFKWKWPWEVAAERKKNSAYA